MNTPAGPNGQRIVALGGGIAFAASLAYCAFAYATRFGVVTDAPPFIVAPIAINLTLFAAFGAHHSILARTSLKDRLRRWIPQSIERPLYVWIASALFVLMLWDWQPIGGVVWRASAPASWILRAMQVAGAVLAVAAGRLVDVLDLAGVRNALGRAPRHPAAPTSRGPYGLVRHPLYLAWLLLVWPMPVMTGTRFLFVLLFTIYLLVAIPLEERDLGRSFGASYGRYAGRVRYRLLPGLY